MAILTSDFQGLPDLPAGVPAVSTTTAGDSRHDRVVPSGGDSGQLTNCARCACNRLEMSPGQFKECARCGEAFCDDCAYEGSVYCGRCFDKLVDRAAAIQFNR